MQARLDHKRTAASSVDNSAAGRTSTASRVSTAATGTSSASLRFATPAQVRRRSLHDDALILARRGLTHGAIAQALGVSRRTVIRWLG